MEEKLTVTTSHVLVFTFSPYRLQDRPQKRAGITMRQQDNQSYLTVVVCSPGSVSTPNTVMLVVVKSKDLQLRPSSQE